MPDSSCSFCGHPVPLESNLCPHCARPSLYPNVRVADQPAERAALAERHRQAVEVAEKHGCGERVRALEKVAEATQAVLCRPLGEVERLASSDRQLYATYHQLLDAEVKLPDGDRWDPLRRKADEALFSVYKEKIHFAALASDGVGLTRYGEFSVELREDMIAHRSSLLEDNSALLLERWAYNLPVGFRAVWADRGLLCVAKLADRVRPDTTAPDLVSLVLRSGDRPEDDRFVEVHIWGSISRRTFARVVLTRRRGTRPPSKARLLALRAKLAEAGVDLEER